jgi:uncharacterized protein with ATP-grasp and redox domains
MWIDNAYCKLCLIYSRTKDLISLGHSHLISKLLVKLADIVERESSRSKAFVEAFEYVKALTRSEDPYTEAKRSLREVGKRVASIAGRYLEAVNWDIGEAIRISAAANIIDTSVLGYESTRSLEEALWDKPVIEDVVELKGYREIYLVLDNAGEAEIDKILAKSLIKHGYRVTLVVREKAYEIDETIESLEREGFDAIATPGSMPPVIYMNKGFVIAKGIANAEAYAELGKEVETLHLFRAKCEVIAKRLGMPKNSILILSGSSIKKVLGEKQ